MIQRAALLLGIGFIAMSTGFGQKPETLFSGVATLDNGLIVRYATTSEARIADSDLAGWSSGELTSGPVAGRNPWVAARDLQRFFVDSRSGIYFGYTLHVSRVSTLMPLTGERKSDARSKPFLVSIEPLTLARQDLPEPFRNARLRPAKLRAYPRNQTVGAGDSIVVDLRLASRAGNTGEDLNLSETLRFSPTGVRTMPAENR